MKVAAGVLFGYGWFRHYLSLKSIEAYTPGGFNRVDKIKLTLLGPLAPLYDVPVTYYMVLHYLSKLNPKRVAEWVVTPKTSFDKTTYEERHWKIEEGKKRPEEPTFYLDTPSLVIIALIVFFFVFVMFSLVISRVPWAVK
jgi:hypothetical protein